MEKNTKHYNPNNFVRITTLNPFRFKFIFLDINSRISQPVFKQHGLDVHYDKRFLEKAGTAYVLIICTIAKRDFLKFMDCMLKLRNNALICGYNDYDKQCNAVIKMFNELEMLKAST
jgi:hypothetical protein